MVWGRKHPLSTSHIRYEPFCHIKWTEQSAVKISVNNGLAILTSTSPREILLSSPLNQSESRKHFTQYSPTNYYDAVCISVEINAYFYVIFSSLWTCNTCNIELWVQCLSRLILFKAWIFLFAFRYVSYINNNRFRALFTYGKLRVLHLICNLIHAEP
jgi:hypothetical protein